MFRLLILGVCLTCVTAQSKAGVYITGPDGVVGNVNFTQSGEELLIEGSVSGLGQGQHGFHIHELGDLTGGCASTGAHFNPFNQFHGAPNATIRHAGDLGNIQADGTGVATINTTDTILSLSGTTSIIGRAVVVHADPDDLGLGGEEDSLTTGHAGARVGCGVIGILEDSGSSTLLPLTSALVLSMIISFLNSSFM